MTNRVSEAGFTVEVGIRFCESTRGGPGEAERAAVEDARAQGVTWSQVARALNRTRQAIEQRLG